MFSRTATRRSAVCHLPVYLGLQSLRPVIRRHVSELKKAPRTHSARIVISTAFAVVTTYSLYGTASFAGFEQTEGRGRDDYDRSDLLRECKVEAFPMINLQAASFLLRLYESTYVGPNGVGRTYSVQVPSYFPGEEYYEILDLDDILDENNENINPEINFLNHSSDKPPISDKIPRVGWAIYDGHLGLACSVLLRHALIGYVLSDILSLYKTSRDNGGDFMPSPIEMDNTIKAAFLRVDREILQEGAEALTTARFLTEALWMTAPAFSGSTALLSLYTPAEKLLRVACVGDSRAVLGRRNRDGSYSTIPMSVDQTGYNPEEASRVRAEHPNEPDVVKDGRVAGMAVTRAFGNGPWKWPREISRELREKYSGTVQAGVETPPYLTAEPVIETIKVQPDDFLIMASDGLWDHMTNEQAVDLVVRWLARLPKSDTSNAQEADDSHQDLSSSTKRAMIYDPRKKIEEKDFVVEDENAATHLVRNAFGGKNRERFYSLMGSLHPYARKLQGDATVHVIFFDNVDTDTTLQNEVFN